jgi:hypothetical protein
MREMLISRGPRDSPGPSFFDNPRRADPRRTHFSE